MGLAMLLCSRVVEFQGPQTSSGHEQEGDILDLFYLLLVYVLYKTCPGSGLVQQVNNELRFTYVENSKDVRVANHCKNE